MNILELHKHYNQATYELVADMLDLSGITFKSDYKYNDDTIYFQLQDMFLNEVAKYKYADMDEATRADLSYLFNSFISSLNERYIRLMYNGKPITYGAVVWDFDNRRATIHPFFD